MSDTANVGQQQAPSESQGQQSQQSQQQGGQIDRDFLAALSAKFDDYDKKLSGAAEHSDTLKKIKDAFEPKKSDKQDQKWIDSHLKSLLEARQRGQEMPITEDLVVQMQRQMDTIDELTQKLQRAEAMIGRFNDPATWQDNQVYSDMDNTLSASIERVYGREAPEIHKTVSSIVAERLKQTRQEAPEVWEKIRNNKDLQKRIIHKALSEVVPPEAMKLMREKHEASQPLTQRDFEAAWKEASEIQDPKVRAKAKELVRQKLYEHSNPFRMRKH
jgi:hypothetical protein